MSFLEEYPQLKIIQDIALDKKTPVFLVGGFIRDFLLGVKKTDFDFAVKKDALKLARAFSRRINGAFVLLDGERGCARVVDTCGNKRGRKTGGDAGARADAHRPMFTYDFADFRAGTFKGDLAHRDFTVNTLAVDLRGLREGDCLKDKLMENEQGLADLRAKKVRRTSANIFKEDPLRMLRAFSLRASLNFRIEYSTLSQIKRESDLLREVSCERIRDELFKILETSNAGAVLSQMDKAGLLEKVIPQVRVMYSCPQGTYHHLDVWQHSLETVRQLDEIVHKGRYNLYPGTLRLDDALAGDIDADLDERVGGVRTRRALVKLAALIHDIGKPDVRRREAGRSIFHGHERKGREIVRHVARMLKLSTRERYALEDMTLWHLRPGYLSNFNKPSDKAVYRFLRDAKEEAVSTVLLSLADQRATRGPATGEQDQRHHEDICLRVIKTHLEKKREKPFVRLINGDDLIKTLKLKPSPLFARILTRVEEEQALGKIKTKKEAFRLAGDILKTRG